MKKTFKKEKMGNKQSSIDARDIFFSYYLMADYYIAPDRYL